MDIQAYIQSGIIESYILGLASEEEAAELEALRLQYPEVKRAILEFSEELEKTAFENAVAPPVELKEKILREILDEPEVEAPVIPVFRDNEEHLAITMNSIRPWRMAAAAAVILLIVSAALNFYLYQQYDNKNQAYNQLVAERNTLANNNQLYHAQLSEWQAAAAMMANPSMATIKMSGLPGKTRGMATIFWDTHSKDVYVMPNSLPQVEQGKQYQLWAIVNGKPVDAGLLDLSCAGVCKMRNIPAAEAFAITVEKSGGSKSPTLAAMVVMGNV